MDEIINSFAYRLQSQGMKLETYLKYTGQTTDDLRVQYKPQAERQVKVRLGLEKIAELEGLKPTEEETEAEYQKLADVLWHAPGECEEPGHRGGHQRRHPESEGH